MSGAFTARGPMLLAQGYQPVTTVAGVAALGVGEWLNPPGWKPKWIWTGDIYQYAAEVKRIRVAGTKGARRTVMTVAGRTRKSNEAPKLVYAATAAQERALLSKPGHMHAVSMPPEVKDMLLDYHGADLTPDMRAICADRIAERSRPAAKPAAPAKKGAKK